MLPQVAVLSAFAIAASATVSAGAPRFAICFDSETPDLHCYNGPDDTPQNVTEADVSFIAKYLRADGRQTKEDRFFTITAQDAPDCAEWSVYASKSALALAKHTDSSKNSSVRFEDIASTIDGGEKATDEDKEKAIIGYLGSGGSLGVQANLDNKVYSSAKYKAANYSPEGVTINIVNNAV